MQPGDVVDARFVIEAVAGSGGMGIVYRAKDLRGGARVALKTVRVLGSPSVLRERFLREAKVLRELSHPGIVRHVAQGQVADGSLYLAMEWLEGEDLRERLARGGLDVAESVAIALAAAEALAAAHAIGVVHRDIKPSNVYLVGGKIGDPGFAVKLLDFGVAYDPDATSRERATETGVVLGTVGYLAPEQVSEGRAVDARADVFSLGCVLYECLTGHRAFAAADLVAALTKILFSEAPRVRELRRDVPAALDDLVWRMIAKDEDDRPPNGAAVAGALRALGAIQPTIRARAASIPVGLTQSERRLVSFLLVDARHEVLSEATAPFTGRLEQLADGTSAITLSGSSAATDMAARAARCALAVRGVVPRAAMALSTGRGDPMGRVAASAAIDRAANLLQIARGRAAEDYAEGARVPIRLDEVTAGLLDPSFEVTGDRFGLLLLSERDAAEGTRTLLGRETQMVGREREMAQLVTYFDDCVDERLARAVLVTAPAGVGKSRVRYELLRALKARGERVEVWIARGDPVSAGSALGLLAQAIRRAAGTLDGEPLDVRRKKLAARVARHVARADASRVAEFLGEIIGAPSGEEGAPGSIELRAARKDPQLMADQKRRAWEDFVAAECAAQPVVLVLEDLHWGDLPTIRLVDAALRSQERAPFFVLALARPTVHDLFPRLWHDRKLQELRLEELSARAAARLAREALGAAAAEATIARVVSRAGGNAFYLEELIRAVAEGHGDELPETVLAMVQARLESLEADARRVLRAASVFGATFWAGGVRALLEGTEGATQVEAWLLELSEREWVMKRASGRFQGEPEYVFRHALVREAAYAMLTDDDRALGHLLAGRWLETIGERDATVLAEHFERGEDRERAVHWYVRGAEEALEANDLLAAIERAERGIAGGARNEARGALRSVQAEAHGWRGENVEAERCAIEARALLAKESPRWPRASSRIVESATRLGHHDRARASAEELLRETEQRPLDDDALAALCECVPPMVMSGQIETAANLMRVIDRATLETAPSDPVVSGNVARARSWFAVTTGDLAEGIHQDEIAAAAFDRAGDRRSACQQRSSYGASCVLLGLHEEARVALANALAVAETLGNHKTTAHAVQSFGLALARSGEAARAIPHLERAAGSYRDQADVRHHGFSMLYLAQALAAVGRADEALDRAREAKDILAAFPTIRAYACGSLARLLLARGAAEDALVEAREAVRLVESLGTIEEGEEAVRLAYAEALFASGDREGARAAIAVARERLLSRAGKVSASAPHVKESMLQRVEENARTLRLAAEWGV